MKSPGTESAIEVIELLRNALEITRKEKLPDHLQCAQDFFLCLYIIGIEEISKIIDGKFDLEVYQQNARELIEESLIGAPFKDQLIEGFARKVSPKIRQNIIKAIKSP